MPADRMAVWGSAPGIASHRFSRFPNVARPRMRGPRSSPQPHPGSRVCRETVCSCAAGPARPGSLPWRCEQPPCARWGGAQASPRPAQSADGQRVGTRCLEGHHASGPQRVHLLGRGCQAGDDPRAPHSPDPGGAGGRPASALLLAGVRPPRAHRQIEPKDPVGKTCIAQERRLDRCGRCPWREAEVNAP